MALMQQLMHGVSILQDDVHKFANVAMADITGYSVEELSGMPYLDIVAPEDKAGAQLAYEAIMAENTGDIANLMGGFEMVCKDGSVKQVEVDNSVITIGGKKAVLSVVQDISSRKRAEEARRETERRFIAFINNFPGIAFLKDTRGNYLYTNSLFDEVMKSNKARSAARNGGKQRANKSPIRLDRTDKLVLKESKTVSTVERVVQHKRPRFLLIYKFPIIGDSGIVNSIGGIGLDITERRNI
jgi:PAS domain S-box-containing protein